VALSSGLQYEDPGVVLLDHVRHVFDACGVDRIFSQSLVVALIAMEGAPWSEWRGPRLFFSACAMRPACR
jgi:hypothetical protein